MGEVIRLDSLHGITHWAAYSVDVTGYRRVGVYRLTGYEDLGAGMLVYHFEAVKGSVKMRRHARFLNLNTFRPFAISGGRGK